MTRLTRSIAAFAALAAMPLVVSPAAAATLGARDGSYGNDAPFARISGVAGAGYDPGTIAALPAGEALIAEDDSRIGMTRLTAEGLPDPSFGKDGTATVSSGLTDNAFGSAVAVASDGSYLVAGAVGDDERLALAQFTSSEVEGRKAGTLDSSFASDSEHPGVFEYTTQVHEEVPKTTVAAGLAVQPDGTILVVGTELIGTPSEAAMMVVRVTSDGNAEQLFSGLQAGGQPTTADGIALGPNGEIYVAGTENAGAADAKGVLARLSFTGFPAHLQLDTSFATNGVFTSALGGSSAELAALAVASDGSVVLAGQVVSGAKDGVVARVTPSGSLDPTFGSGGVLRLQTTSPQPPMAFVRSIVLEPDGAPVIAGDTGEHDALGGFPAATSFVAQMTSSGGLDASFDSAAALPGVTFEPTISGYSEATATGLAMDEQGRLLLATDVSSTTPGEPDEGVVQRFVDYAQPKAEFSVPLSVFAGEATTFDGSSSSDAVGSITDYAWDFDGSESFATDGGDSPTIEHTFTTPGTVTVSLRVTNAAGQASVAHEQVIVRPRALPQIPGATPRVSLSTSSLSFSVDINDFDGTYVDSNPQTVYVTNVGTGPLTLGSVGIVDSAGGFAIANRCVSILGPEGFLTTCAPTDDPADTCANTTLEPGTRCYVTVEYERGEQFPNATGELEIDSDAASSPDLVALSANATVISDNPASGPTRCPGTIRGLSGTLAACWSDATSAAGSEADLWGAYGPVTISGQVTLDPTRSGDELYIDNDTIYATPSDAEYTVEVANSPTATPSIPIGTLDLGAKQYVCAYNGKACSSPLSISNPDHYAIHGLEITGGEIFFEGGSVIPGGATACSSAASFAFTKLPVRLFSSSPATAEAPTVTFEFGGCTNAPTPGAGEGGEGGPYTCPGEAKPTPNCSGHVFPPSHVPDALSAGSRPLARASDVSSEGTSGSCPSGYVDYSETPPETFVGAMDFGTPYLCYEPASQVWTAGGTFKILNATINTGPPPEDGISFRSDGTFVGGGIEKLSLGEPGLALVPPVFLNSLSGNYHTDPTRLQARATVNVGGLLSITGGAFAVWANEAHPYSYPTGCEEPNCPLPGVSRLQLDTSGKKALTQFAAGASGTVSLRELPVVGSIQLASAYVFYYAQGYFEFAGCLGSCEGGLSFLGGAITVEGKVYGALDTTNGQYNLGGKFKGCVNWPVVGSTCLGVKGVVSDIGVGACAELSAFGLEGKAFARYTWSGELTIDLGCELGPVEVAVSAGEARAARAADASHALTVQLPGGAPTTTITVKGDGGAPDLALSGPGGAQLSEPSSTSGAHTRDLVIWPEPKLHETLIGIVHPARGPWTITPLPGSVPITQVSRVDALAPAKIAATVSGRGSVRALAYRVRPRPGQQVTFAERSDGVFHVLGKATGERGVLHFTPAPGPAGERDIEALITLSGTPSPAITAGHYVAPPPPRAGEPSDVRVTRSANALRIAWGSAAQASRYLVTVSLSDGQQASFEKPAIARALTIPTVGPAVSGEVSVMALTANGTSGAAATKRIAPARSPGRVRGLRTLRTSRGVVVEWRTVPGATLYLLRVSVPGSPAYAPTTLPKPRFTSTSTLVQLKAGSVATVTVTALGSGGEQGPASSIRYRAAR